MSKDDGDKTIFGGKLPPQPASGQNPNTQGSPFGGKPPAGAQQPQDGDRTIIGGALPPAGGAGGRVAPTGPPAQGGFAQPQGGFAPPPQQGGFVPPQPGGFAPPASPESNPWGTPYPSPHAPSSGIGQPLDQDQGFFPQVPPVQEAAPQQQAQPRISLDQALRTSGGASSGSSNPLIAASSDLLILLGRLRTGLVEMDAGPLMDHVTREIDQFQRNALAAGVDPHETEVAKYVLCSTADDIVQNLPGADKGAWIQYSMVARFFHRRDSGVGFFQEAEKAMLSPGQRFYQLELMLTCLSLGFEGQYRTMPNGPADLARIRRAIYEALRRVQARPDEDVSVRWTPVPLGGKRRFGAFPVWAAGAFALILLVAFFATLRTLISQDGAAVANQLNFLHPKEPVALERTVFVQYVPPETTQLERIQEAMRGELDEGLVEIGPKGDYIYVRVGNLLLFESASAELKPEFEELAGRIAETLEGEEGPILVVGFTDSEPMSGRGRYKTNQELSEARATSVSDVLAALISDSSRITVEGRGPAEPIADNSTREGQALNRRVEIMIAREGTF